MKKLTSLLINLIIYKPIFLFIRFYQYTFSPNHGLYGNLFPVYGCKFHPSCSEYSLAALRQYGLLHGLVASVKRIIKCGPWSEGGYDPI